ncbi:MAG: monovalent cation/H+ antiporter complex subunit F [Bacteroidales bacterium]|nr:monovalent cation/H+ antiporter complex subunit F [Bacteroidales bacterium]
MILENVILYFILPVLSISMLLIFIRVFKGPRLMDRVVALDLLVIVGIGSFSAYAILHNKEVFIDISLILALIAFLSTVAFTWYYVKGDIEKDKFDQR